MRKAMVMMVGFVLLAGGGAQAGLLAADWDTGDLYSVSTLDASMTLIGNTGLTFSVGGLEYRQSDGTLFAFSAGLPAATPTLYTVNPSTAALTPVGPLGLSTFEGGLAIAPDGTAYGVNQGTNTTCALFSVNLSTGAAASIGTIGNGAHDINGLTYRSDGKLVGFDRVTNSLLEIDPTTPGTPTTIAVLNPGAGTVGGIAYDGQNYYLATGNDGGGSNSLYSVDVSTGALTLIGSFSPTITGIAVGVSGLAATVVPEPAGLGLIGIALLALRKKRC